MDSQGLVRTRVDLTESGPDLTALPSQRHFSIKTVAENPVQQIVRLLRKHRWTILACTAIITSLFLLNAARQPRLYRATASIAIYRDAGVIPSNKDGSPDLSDPDGYGEMTLETYILQSRMMALSVVRQLTLTQNVEFMRQARSQDGNARRANRDGNSTVNESESIAIDAVLRGLRVDPVKQTRVVQVSFTGPDLALDAAIVNALVDHFIEDGIRSRYEAFQRSAQFLTVQLADLRTKLEQAQEKLVQYEREHNIIGIDEKQNIVTAKLDELNKQLTAAEADRIGRESVFQTISSGNLEDIPNNKAGETLQSLRLREAELRNEYAQASTTYGPKYPKVLELQSRINAIEASIRAELQRLQSRARAEYETSLRRERKLRAAFESQKAEANRLNESAIQYGLLKHDVDSNRQLYDTLQERVKLAGVVAGLRSSNIRLIDSAEPPRLPFSPNLPKSIYLGLFVSFLVSAAVVGVRESLNRGLHDPDEVEAFTAMPPLAVIPVWENGMQKFFVGLEDETDGIVSLSHPRSGVAEAYRALGTSIMLASPDLKILLVTSPLPGEGKTTSAANAAVVLAKQGKRVLLIDADLRKPALHSGFGISNDSGLTCILSGQTSCENAVLPYERVPNLLLLPAGPPTSAPAEMLGSAMMREQMGLWRQQYDYVIVDTPPVLAVTDAVRLAGYADSVLLVLRAGQTRREALTRACSLFNQNSIPVLGMVVNALKLRSANSYYSYYPQLAKTYYREEPQHHS